MRKPLESTAYSPAKHDPASMANAVRICPALSFSIMETSAPMSPAISNTLTHLECGLCSRKYEPGKVHNLCECGGPLLVRTARLGGRIGAEQLWIKDEGLNPTGSFKARGLSCAVSMAVELGIRKLAIPSAGNAASAMAAYAAAAGLEAHIFMPRDVPRANYIECKAFGSKVTLVDGLISDCGRMVAERKDAEGWFDVSTLKEPFRIEGKKTMGYEVAEQLGWR